MSIAENTFEKDIIGTKSDDLEINFIGHGTLMLFFKGKVIHIDPWSRLADYSEMQKADIILLTHDHPDHLDLKAIDILRTDKTILLLTETCAKQVDGGDIMRNGDIREINGLKLKAVPAYNIVHQHSEGNPYHPIGVGNGYVIAFEDKKVYIGGDTENIPEMKELKGIDIAFLPMNLPYTMTPEMVADAALTIRPKILYPYHFGNSDTSKIKELLKDYSDIDVRIRQMQ